MLYYLTQIFTVTVKVDCQKVGRQRLKSVINMLTYVNCLLQVVHRKQFLCQTWRSAFICSIAYTVLSQDLHTELTSGRKTPFYKWIKLDICTAVQSHICDICNHNYVRDKIGKIFSHIVNWIKSGIGQRR